MTVRTCPPGINTTAWAAALPRRRTRETNPLERIMELREGDESVEILTTDEKPGQGQKRARER
jgi:hypothetical protein